MGYLEKQTLNKLLFPKMLLFPTYSLLVKPLSLCLVVRRNREKIEVGWEEVEDKMNRKSVGFQVVWIKRNKERKLSSVFTFLVG